MGEFRRTAALVMAAAAVITSCSSTRTVTQPGAPPVTTNSTAATAAPSATTIASIATTVVTTHSTATTTASTTPRPTTAPTTTPTTASGVSIPDGPITVCQFTAAAPSGEITWVQDGQLRALADDGVPRCLVASATVPLPKWSPTGDRLLIDPSTAIGATTLRPTGYAAAATSVSWSQPTGKAFIAIDPATHRLIWHASTNSQTEDISFLARTDEAVYHPAGKAIAAVGVDENGHYGVWLASNRGLNRQLITSIDDPTTQATHLSFSADGRILYFVHRAVHALILDGLILNEIGVEGQADSNVVASTVGDAQAWTTGPCDSSGSLVARVDQATPQDLRTANGSPFTGASSTLQPVGWLGGARLVLIARNSGCDGPGDVWTWSLSSGFTKVGSGWSSVAVRIPHGAFVDLPAKIEQAAPG